MWRINRIKGRNFLLFESFDVSIQSGETTFILGDIEVKSSNSNGAGKSSFLSAIRMAITDTPEKDKTKDDYIRWGEKSGFLSFEMHNFRTNETLKVDRILNRGTKSNSISIELNGDLIKDFVSVQDANNFILDKIGIDKTDLLNYYFISQENKSHFLRSNDKDKKDIIWRFAGTDNLDNFIIFIQEKIDYLSLKRDGRIKNIKELEGEISLLQREIELTNKVSDKSERAQVIEELKQLRKTKEEELKNAERALDKTDYGLKIDKVLEYIKEEEKMLAENSISFRKIKDKIQKVDEEYKRAKVASAGVVECPECSHTFSPDLGIDSVEIEELLEKLSVMGNKLTKKKKVQEDSLSSMKDAINELKTQKDEYNYKVRDAAHQKKKIDEYHSEIRKLGERIKDFESKKDTVIDTSDIESQIGKLSIKLNSFKTILQKIDNQILSLKGSKDKVSKSFKAYLVGRSLQVLEDVINKKLRLLEFEYLVKLQGFKVLKTGDMRENISISVSENNEEWVSFNALSAGQKMRISISTILSIQDILNNSSESGGIDLLILDEAFDGLDEVGQEYAIKLLVQTKRTILAVTHHRIEYDGNVLTVQTKNKNTFIYEKDAKGRQDKDD